MKHNGKTDHLGTDTAAGCLFALGGIVATSGALAEFTPEELMASLRRHAAGDWGKLDDHDVAVNRAAITDGARLVSCYEFGGRRLWIITEADRSATTFLLPEEY